MSVVTVRRISLCTVNFRGMELGLQRLYTRLMAVRGASDICTYSRSKKSRTGLTGGFFSSTGPLSSVGLIYTYKLRHKSGGGAHVERGARACSGCKFRASGCTFYQFSLIRRTSVPKRITGLQFRFQKIKRQRFGYIM